MTLPVIGALGAGRMGRGIAIAAAYAGLDVRMIDVKPRPAADADTLRDAALAGRSASRESVHHRVDVRLAPFGFVPVRVEP